MGKQKSDELIKGYYFKRIVIRPADVNIQVFRDTLMDSLINFYQKKYDYYSIFEEGGAKGLHLDINFWVSEKQIKQFNKGKYNEAKILCQKFCDVNPSSSSHIMYKPCQIAETRDNQLLQVGYNQKEGKGIYNIPEELVNEGVKIYDERKHLKHLADDIHIPSTNALNPKNVVSYMLFERTETQSELLNLPFEMIKKGYSFVGLSKNVMRKAILEIRVRTGELEKYTKQEIQEENGLIKEDQILYDLDCARQIIRNVEYHIGEYMNPEDSLTKDLICLLHGGKVMK